MMTTPIQPFTEIDPGKLEAITPSQFLTFTMPHPIHLHRLLRVAVCDSPLANADDSSPSISVVFVPKNRETDWNFCTESGHMQLLLKLRVSRLILIGDLPPHQGPSIYKLPPVSQTAEKERLLNELKPLMIPLLPKSIFTSDNGLRKIVFLTAVEDAAYRVTVAKVASPIVGEFLVEDVELVGFSDRNKQLRRRLRFKRMPKVIQSQALLVPIIGDDEATTQTDLESLRNIESATFEPDTRVLVHHYLIAMVSCLSLIASHLAQFFRPKALCFGIGGGVLLSFLDTQMKFEVTGVEIDPMVIMASTFHFGFNRLNSIRLIIKDAIETIQNFPNREPPKVEKFDVIFVDLDSSDAKIGFCAPPQEFCKKHVFEGLRLLLDEQGGLIMNVVPLNKVFYETLVKELKEIFHKVYEIDVKNADNFVVMAIVSPPSFVTFEYLFLNKLKSLIPGTYWNSVVEL
ncbi:hypothetical protein LXL04_018338 [Taraxacum kok-saghyz]